MLKLFAYLRIKFNNLVIRLFFRKPKMDKKYYLSLCTIFKNEAKYLKEWIDYHLIVGYEHFYVYNNFSEDNYKEILAPYIEKGLLTLIEWPIKAGQMQAYNDCVEKYKNESCWIAFQDVDEFAVPIKYNDVKDYLKQFEKFPCVLGFYRNFSSNGILTENTDIPVIEQFTSCDKFMSPSMFLNTYFCNLIKIFRLTHFARFKFFNKICPQYASFFCGLTDDIKNPDFQFNHYYCKSYEYFMNKKIPNGDAFSSKYAQTTQFFFNAEHRAIYKDYAIFKYLTQLKIFDLDKYCKEKSTSD